MINTETTVREVAARYPQSLKVFDRYGIDYCCGGRERLADAASRQEIALEQLAPALRKTGNAWGGLRC